ncbi:MAG: RluA family pseudouridine synthase [Firmicutes bacterium]|nr:RluA family pseudouridine synthase [Bacillota bacterium]
MSQNWQNDRLGEELQFVVPQHWAGGRLDHFITNEISEYSRSFLRRLLDQGLITVNGHSVKAGYKLRTGESVHIIIPPTKGLSVEPEDILLDVVYEDADIIVVNKPAGMVVHPAFGNPGGTLVNALKAHTSDLSDIGGAHRPGIIHRLDKDTSGVMVTAKNNYAHMAIAQQIKERQAERWYLALVFGNIVRNEGTVDAPIARHPVNRKKMAVCEGGRNARTHYYVRERFGDYTLVECRLETGRTHQIRVHLSYIRHPLVGDLVYGPKRNKLNLKRQALHAYRLGLYHPRQQKFVEFEAPLPQDINNALKMLEKR